MQRSINFIMAIIFGAIIALGLAQFFAIAAFFQNWFGGYMLLAIICAAFVSGLPILSTVLGILGAVLMWNFSILGALCLFFPLLIVYIPMLFGVSVFALYAIIRSWLMRAFGRRGY